MSQIEAAKNRHSVRNYKPERIQQDKVAKITEKIEELNREGNLHLQFIEDAGKPHKSKDMEQVIEAKGKSF